MDAGETAEVLVVDDDPQVRELFVAFLEDTYDVRAAGSGSEALELLSDETDIVLLDRRMPDMSGREVLEAIRSRGHDCRVAMVTAVRPDMDIVDMKFDDYIVKPVTASKLQNTIDSLLGWAEYDALLREYFETAQKIELLNEEQPREKLESNEEYQQLQERLTSLRADADEARTGIVPEMLSTISDREDRNRTSERFLKFSKER